MTSLRKWWKGLNQRSKSSCLILGSDRRAAHRKSAKVTRRNLLLIVQPECKHAISFLCCSVTWSCLTLPTRRLQHARLPCPSPSPGVCSNLCPLSWWCHPSISSSVIPFSSCLQSFPASGSFLMSQLFASWDQSIGASVSASLLLMISFRIDWFHLSLWESKELSRVLSKFYFAMHILAKALHKLLIFVIKLVRPHRELMVCDFLGNYFAFWSSPTLFLYRPLFVILSADPKL